MYLIYIIFPGKWPSRGETGSQTGVRPVEINTVFSRGERNWALISARVKFKSQGATDGITAKMILCGFGQPLTFKSRRRKRGLRGKGGGGGVALILARPRGGHRMRGAGALLVPRKKGEPVRSRKEHRWRGKTTVKEEFPWMLPHKLGGSQDLRPWENWASCCNHIGKDAGFASETQKNAEGKSKKISRQAKCQYLYSRGWGDLSLLLQQKGRNLERKVKPGG